MPIIDKVKELQSAGYSEQEIIQKLREQGISPKDINDVINQMKVKSAVGNNSATSEQERGEEGIENIPSPTEAEYPQAPPYAQYSPYPEQEQAPQQQAPFPQPQAQYPQQETEESYIYPTPQAYAQYPEYQYQQAGIGADTVTEIAQQLIEEKISEIKKIAKEISEFKTITETKIINIDERLKRIEKTIEQLNFAILDKIGEFGKSLQSTKKELSLMESTFGKMLKPRKRRKK